MKIFDNVLPDDQFLALQNVVMGKDLPWFSGRTARLDDPLENPYLNGWSYFVYSGGEWRTQREEIIRSVYDILRRVDSEFSPVTYLLRVRLVLNTTAPEPYLNGAHVDFLDDHKTVLLYLNDADGDTVLYREKSTGEDVVPDNLTVLDTVSPRANRILCFDGRHFHTGTIPVKSHRRIVMNINYS